MKTEDGRQKTEDGRKEAIRLIPELTERLQDCMTARLQVFGLKENNYLW